MTPYNLLHQLIDFIDSTPYIKGVLHASTGINKEKSKVFLIRIIVVDKTTDISLHEESVCFMHEPLTNIKIFQFDNKEDMEELDEYIEKFKQEMLSYIESDKAPA